MNGCAADCNPRPTFSKGTANVSPFTVTSGRGCVKWNRRVYADFSNEAITVVLMPPRGVKAASMVMRLG